VFSSKRAEVLQRLLARERVFATDWFRTKYEQQARRNLEVSIRKLTQPSP
jgi:predicted metal-dependent HD superfamily phosphohydrolase